VAREEQISTEEVGAVQGICMAVSAGRVNAQMKVIEAKQKERDVG
jgi:hypothetical protein